MGGISGILDFSQGVNPSILQNMTDAVRHRGPDDEGYVFFTQTAVLSARGKDSIQTACRADISIEGVPSGIYAFALGFRRLAITDISPYAHQPMMYAERYVAVFNGEIYNYLELKVELAELGYLFHGISDTEVLVAAYAAWGRECVHRFNGMWAFCIYDREKKELFLSRDRFGVKPLYYWKCGDKLLFASEIKQILEAPFVPRIVDNQSAALHLFHFVQDTSERTFFKDILALPAGCNMMGIVDFEAQELRNLKIERYYDLKSRVLPLTTQDKSSEKLGEALRNAVQLCMLGDLKVGSCLSGGLDSSSIVALACDYIRKAGENPMTFKTITSGFPAHPEIDETCYAKLVANAAGCSNQAVTPVLQANGSEIENMIWHLDQPVTSFSLLVQRNVFRAAAQEGVRILLDGQGSDENLAGYNEQYYAYLCNCLKNEGLTLFIKHFRQAVQNSGMSRRQLINGVRKKFRNKISLRDDPVIFSDLLKHSVSDAVVWDLLSCKENQEVLYNDLLCTNLPQILHWVDRNAMTFSVETRNPFVDHNFVELALSISLSDKLENGWTKYPLRDYMKDKMPEEVVWRKNKFGFPAPDRAWLYGLDRDYVLDLFNNARSAPYYNIPMLREQYLKQENPHFPLVRFVLFEIWMRLFKMEIKEDA